MAAPLVTRPIWSYDKPALYRFQVSYKRRDEGVPETFDRATFARVQSGDTKRSSRLSNLDLYDLKRSIISGLASSP